MGPFLDIYGLTDHRDRETIERFLNEYGDRPTMEDRGDSQLMILCLGKSPEEAKRLEDYEWEAVPTLTQAIQRGLEFPRRAFTLYVAPGRNKPVDNLTVSFTMDNLLILGLSLPYWEDCVAQLIRARELLLGLVRDYDCSMALIGVENPPPLNEEEFRETVNTRQYTLYGWQRETEQR